jgi:hypothetical protein
MSTLDYPRAQPNMELPPAFRPKQGVNRLREIEAQRARLRDEHDHVLLDLACRLTDDRIAAVLEIGSGEGAAKRRRAARRRLLQSDPQFVAKADADRARRQLSAKRKAGKELAKAMDDRHHRAGAADWTPSPGEQILPSAGSGRKLQPLPGAE